MALLSSVDDSGLFTTSAAEMNSMAPHVRSGNLEDILADQLHALCSFININERLVRGAKDAEREISQLHVENRRLRVHLAKPGIAPNIQELAAKSVEAEISELQIENQRLRAQLAEPVPAPVADVGDSGIETGPTTESIQPARNAEVSSPKSEDRRTSPHHVPSPPAPRTQQAAADLNDSRRDTSLTLKSRSEEMPPLHSGDNRMSQHHAPSQPLPWKQAVTPPGMISESSGQESFGDPLDSIPISNVLMETGILPGYESTKSITSCTSFEGKRRELNTKGPSQHSGSEASSTPSSSFRRRVSTGACFHRPLSPHYKRKDTHSCMSRLPLFRWLSPEMMTELCASCEQCTFPEGEVLANQGDRRNDFFAVVEGCVSVRVDGFEIDSLSAGDSFGEDCMLHNEPSHATMVAKTELIALKICGDDLKNPELLEKLKSSSKDIVVHKKSERPQLIFPDADALKEELRDNMVERKYDVQNFYKETGVMQSIARSTVFDNLTQVVIALNAVWISIDTDYNEADLLVNAAPEFIAVENLFGVYFSWELMTRFLSFQRKRDAFTDNWFLFDGFLVLTMALENWVMTLLMLMIGGGDSGGFGNVAILRIFRLLRLSKMARMVRLLRMMPELVVIIKGMVAAMRSVFFTFCLLAAIVYVFAIAFVQLMKGTTAGDEYFGSVPEAMNSLFLNVVLPDEMAIIEDVGEDGWPFKCLIIVYTLLASLTVINLLVGVLCEVVSVVSSVEKEAMTINYVKDTLLQMLDESGLDANGDHMISQDELGDLLKYPGAAQALAEVGVDALGLVDFTDFIFEDVEELSFGDFMKVVLQLRGSNMATVKDMVDLRKVVMDGLHGLAKMQSEALDPLMAKLESQVNPFVHTKTFEDLQGSAKWATAASTRLDAAATELSAAMGKLHTQNDENQKVRPTSNPSRRTTT